MNKKPLLTTIAFFSYLTVLFLAARWVGHWRLHGLWARLLILYTLF